MTIEDIARTAYEVNRAACKHNGDSCDKSWNELERGQQDITKRMVNYFISNPNSTPGDCHNAWIQEKKADGWVWGDEEDAAKKTHPNFVCYEFLPDVKRLEYKLFHAVVRACLNSPV